MFNILADDTNSECVVHGFIKEIPIKLDNVGVVLCLKKLYGFFLSPRKFEMKSENLLCIRLAYQVFSLRPLSVRNVSQITDEELCKSWCFSFQTRADQLS
jgi:hypothetical protein